MDNNKFYKFTFQSDLMKESVDERVITTEFLLDYFPYKNRFHCHEDRGLSFSKELYIQYRTELNQDRAKSGKPPMSDRDLREVIEKYCRLQEIRP